MRHLANAFSRGWGRNRPPASWAGVFSAGFGVRCAGRDRAGHVEGPTCRLALLASPVGVRPAVSVGPDGLIVAAPFTGRARRVVHGLKFRNRRAVAALLVSTADPAPSSHRAGLGDAAQLQGQVAVG